MEANQEFFTVKGLSSYLKLSLPETYKLISSNAIVYFRVGNSRGAIRIKTSDVEAFLNTRRYGPTVLPPPPPQRATPHKLKHIKLRK